MPKTHWTNRLSFIITASAFSIGLGNIWRFPYITGEGGGGAFLLVYLVLILLVGIPIMTMEIGLGRMSSTTPLLGYGNLSRNDKWNFIGWIEFITVFLIMCFYVMILAWVIMYFGESVGSTLGELSRTELPEHFNQITSNIKTVFSCIVGILVLASVIVHQGLQQGLEKYSKWMMIGLLFLLIGLAVWASTLEGALEGYRFYLTPDFSKIGLDTVLVALGQLFFSLGVGMAAAFVFGSYTSEKDNLISSTSWIVFADSFVAVLAGFMIFPVIFSYNLAPDSGPNLIFITMASAFSEMDNGQWVGSLFFILLFLAGFTSLISCMQGMKDSIKDRFSFSDNKALMTISISLLIVSLPMVLSYTKSPVRVFGMNMYQLTDYLTGTILLPLGGILIVVFGAHVVGYNKLKEHLLKGTDNMQIGVYWKFILKWLIPIALTVILLNGLL